MTDPFLKKFLLNIPIRWKLHITIFTLLLLMGLSVLWVVEKGVSASFEQELQEDALAIGEMLAANTVTPILTDDLMVLHNLVTNALKAEKELKYIYILSTQKEVLAHTFSKGFPAALLTAADTTELSNQSLHRVLSTDEGIIHETRTPILRGNAGHVYIGMSQDTMLVAIKKMRLNLLAITALVFSFGALVSIILSQLIIKPITSLVRATKQIGEGSLDIDVPSHRNDEIGGLTKSFNDMAVTLKANMAKRKITERDLRESKELYMSLIEGIDLGITFIDKDQNIIIANSAQAKMFDLDQEKIAGEKCYQQFGNKNKLCKNCPGIIAMDEDRAVVKQVERKRKDGSSFTIKTNSFPVKNAFNVTLGFIEVVEDISEQVHMHEELQKIEHIESIGHLAAGLAHDFNNLLAAILGNIELAQTTISPEETAYQRLNSAEVACEHARVLANQLLTFSKGGDPLKITTFIPQLLEHCCQFSLSGISQKWVLDAPDNIWPVNLDQGQMGQVIQGLLINAKEASTTSG